MNNNNQESFDKHQISTIEHPIRTRMHQWASHEHPISINEPSCPQRASPNRDFWKHVLGRHSGSSRKALRKLTGSPQKPFRMFSGSSQEAFRRLTRGNLLPWCKRVTQKPSEVKNIDFVMWFTACLKKKATISLQSGQGLMHGVYEIATRMSNGVSWTGRQSHPLSQHRKNPFSASTVWGGMIFN